MNRNLQNNKFAYRAKKKFIKALKRRKVNKRRRLGFLNFINLLRKNAKSQNIPFTPPLYAKQQYVRKLGKKPEYNDWIKFLIPMYMKFCTKQLDYNNNGYLYIPKIFSLSEGDGNEESMYFLKNLFYLLYSKNVDKIILDYVNCEYLDLDASALMDIILAGFIENFTKCTRAGHEIRIKSIEPINYLKREEIKEVLFSIGAYANLRGFKLKNDTLIPFNFRIGDKEIDKEGKLKEIHETEIVDYVIDCLKETNRTLTSDAESHISKVVGEVMANAEEHSKFRYRFAVGYFKKPNNFNNNLGTFKLVIFNFGQTIYESFKNSDCQNIFVVNQMKELSEHYTRKKWQYLGRSKFEEQPLWTLYALQERVTSVKDCRRGNGSIRFIDRFFKLKGNDDKDNISKLTLISGNTHIIFDGTYKLKDKIIGTESFKVMAFNDNGNIKELPDEKYVKFADQFFPGTIISAKICITYNNIETDDNGKKMSNIS